MEEAVWLMTFSFLYAENASAVLRRSKGRSDMEVKMSQIGVNHLTFAYEGSFDNIFEDVSFTIEKDWKLGLIGRNGKGRCV